MFGVLETIGSKLINAWIKLLSKFCSHLLIWPSHSTSLPENIPQAKEVIIDLVEYHVIDPQQHLTQFNFNTFEQLVAVIPNWCIPYPYVSKVYNSEHTGTDRTWGSQYTYLYSLYKVILYFIVILCITGDLQLIVHALHDLSFSQIIIIST